VPASRSLSFHEIGKVLDRITSRRVPAALALQTKYELVINLKTAKALGLDIPPPCSPAPTR
jgi:ABC-type uncharacterized transport system substrate-binding protein